MVTNKLLEHIRFIFFWSCGSRNSNKTRVATEVYSFCSIYFFLNSKNQATCSSRNSGKILKIGETKLIYNSRKSKKMGEFIETNIELTMSKLQRRLATDATRQQ